MEASSKKTCTAEGSVMAAYRNVMASTCCAQFEIEVEERNMNRWIVKMDRITFVAEGPQIFKDLSWLEGNGYGNGKIELEVFSDSSYPRLPPFVRIVSPRFHALTGHVTSGGSICTDMLTPEGWFPKMGMETVLMQLHALFIKGGARIVRSQHEPYSLLEAKEAFKRVADAHGWQTTGLPDTMKNA